VPCRGRERGREFRRGLVKFCASGLLREFPRQLPTIGGFDGGNDSTDHYRCAPLHTQFGTGVAKSIRIRPTTAVLDSSARLASVRGRRSIALGHDRSEASRSSGSVRLVTSRRTRSCDRRVGACTARDASGCRPLLGAEGSPAGSMEAPTPGVPNLRGQTRGGRRRRGTPAPLGSLRRPAEGASRHGTSDDRRNRHGGRRAEDQGRATASRHP